jgi:hypothetical protein
MIHSEDMWTEVYTKQALINGQAQQNFLLNFAFCKP